MTSKEPVVDLVEDEQIQYENDNIDASDVDMESLQDTTPDISAAYIYMKQVNDYSKYTNVNSYWDPMNQPDELCMDNPEMADILDSIDTTTKEILRYMKIVAELLQKNINVTGMGTDIPTSEA